MKNSALLLLCLFCQYLAYAQGYDPEKVNKKAVKFYGQAMERAQDGNYVSAAGLLLQAIETDAGYLDAYLSLAGVYGQLKNYGASVRYYELAFGMDSNYTIEYLLPYSINLAGLGEFEKALGAINELFAKKPPKNSTTFKAAEYRKKTYEFAIDLAKRNQDKGYAFTPVNMGPHINTGESEYFPSLTLDGRQLVFTRRLNNRNEDFFASRRDSATWLPARPVPGNVNTPQNEGAQNISQDGTWLVFTGCYRPAGFGGCDLFISYLEKEGWSEPVNMGSAINTDQWESQPCLSPDKRALYFASTRFGGYGGSDIYVSYLLPNGKWGDPENLGPGINTSGNEASPFIHADNQTLYFTSSGLQGYGNSDLFYARKGPGGDWSKPVNLGYPINTIDEEGSIFISADGKTAYYASDRADSRGGLDIYSFELREDVRPYKTLWVSGQVFDAKTRKGLPSAVELIDLSTRQVVARVHTDEIGNYMITLPLGKDYAFNVNRKGYLFYSDNFFMKDRDPDSTYEKNIPLHPIETNATIVLRNIFFDVNKFELRPESQVELDRLVQLLNENPTLKIEIGGHTDNVGKPADNLVLSNNRARAVVNYLLQRGIAAQRLSAKGYGETRPVADNRTEEGRAQNRRTEMKIIAR